MVYGFDIDIDDFLHMEAAEPEQEKKPAKPPLKGPRPRGENASRSGTRGKEEIKSKQVGKRVSSVAGDETSKKMRTTNFNSDSGKDGARMGSANKKNRNKNRLASVGNDDTDSVESSDFRNQQKMGDGLLKANERELFNKRPKVSSSMNPGEKKNSSILAFSGAPAQESGILGGAARAKIDELNCFGESPMKSKFERSEESQRIPSFSGANPEKAF
jgi:hypothetical protein